MSIGGLQFNSFDMSFDQMRNRIADFSPLDSKLHNHLLKVYTSLAATFGAATLGALCHLKYGVGGLLTFVAELIVLSCITGIPHNRGTILSRFGLLLSFGFLLGCSIGPLVSYAIHLQPIIVLQALICTLVIFVCFSVSALYAKERQWLFLGGFLASAINLLLTISLLNIFFRSSVLFSIQLYFGLLVFCGFVIFDTQLIMEKSKTSDDFISDSLRLFLDFAGIFVRILRILSDKSQNSKNNKRR